MIVVTKPSNEADHGAIRYIADHALVQPAEHFESTVDEFIGTVLARLEVQSLRSTNLHDVWKSVLEDRANPKENERRRFEAILGLEPDELSLDQFDQISDAASEFGTSAMEEFLAADQSLTAADAICKVKSGFDFNPSSIRSLAKHSDAPSSTEKPWVAGARIASHVRDMLNNSEAPVSDKELGEVISVSEEVLQQGTEVAEMPMALEENEAQSKLILRSRIPTGKRFELARLLGDQVAYSVTGRFSLCSSAQTYRQKFQRAFAAEFLCPFDSMFDHMHRRTDSDSIDEVAAQYGVSPLVVQNHLINRGHIKRNDLDNDVETAA